MVASLLHSQCDEASPIGNFVAPMDLIFDLFFPRIWRDIFGLGSGRVLHSSIPLFPNCVGDRTFGSVSFFLEPSLEGFADVVL